MKTYNNLYYWLSSVGNLTLAWRKAREEKTSHEDVIEFEKNIELNLLNLHTELHTKTYKPRPLVTFVLRDPKTRVIAKSDFRDRVVHHALLNVIKVYFEKQFIYDSCANQVGKGTTFALKRFHTFMRKGSHPQNESGFCLKADIKHYFQNVNHTILLTILQRKITDPNVLWLIKQILATNAEFRRGGGDRTQRTNVTKGEASGVSPTQGMPLGNYTSQFFANVYLNELDYFVKHTLKAKYYIRYVDDFVILHRSAKQLAEWKEQIDIFLTEKLRLSLHPDKSRIVPLKRGIDFVGFRNFYHKRLLRKRNIRNMQRKIALYKEGGLSFTDISASYQGWQGYAKWANTYKKREKIKRNIIYILWEKV